MTLPTKSNSEDPSVHLDAFKNKFCNLNLSRIERNVKQILRSYSHAQCSHQYTSHKYGKLIHLMQ